DVKARVLAQDHRRLEHVVDERLDRERLAIQVEPPFVRASERQETIHEVRHPRRLLESLLERDEMFGGRGRRMHRALYVRTKHREWRFQLVARIGREAPQRSE